MSIIRPGRRSLARVALALLTLTLAPALPASAGVGNSGSHASGTVGTYALTDTRHVPGAWAAYDAVTMRIRTLTAFAPSLFAAGPGNQRVGAQARLQLLAPHASGWATVATSAEVKGTATEAAAPALPAHTFSAMATGSYRVQWHLSWYAADGTTPTGTANLMVTWYGQRIGRKIEAGVHQGSQLGSIAGIPAVQVKHGSRRVKTVALTFDFGGRIGDAHAIVRWLIDHGVPATIFAVGTTAITPGGTHALALAATQPDLFRVGNHSLTHPDFTELDATQIARQLKGADADIEPITGQSTRPFFRPPYGRRTDATLAAVGKAGWSLCVSWDTTTDDYLPISQGGPTPDELVAEVLDKVRPGSIVIMHLGGYSTYAALPRIVSGLRSRGLSPVSLSSLLRLDP
jgi:peptidoglycan/xylan/chitin deacetylase (PgdA/CDA1 family)